MHGLHDMFYFERKKTFMHILTVFVCGYLPAAMFNVNQRICNQLVESNIN